MVRSGQQRNIKKIFQKYNAFDLAQFSLLKTRIVYFYPLVTSHFGGF